MAGKLQENGRKLVSCHLIVIFLRDISAAKPSVSVGFASIMMQNHRKWMVSQPECVGEKTKLNSRKTASCHFPAIFLPFN
jgi:hypothetical protein